MSPLEFALSMAKKNVAIIPLQFKKKIPSIVWAKYQKQMPTESELREWLNKPSNLGIITGKISRLIVVDLDSPQALYWAQSNLPDTPMKTETASGEHWYYQYPATSSEIKNSVKFEYDGKLLDLDVRADGGYVVAPYSIHPSEVLYKEKQPWASIQISDLPVFNTQWFPNHKTIISSEPQKNISFDQNILRSLERFGPAVQGQGGDKHTFTIACFLIRNCGLSFDEALMYLQEWNLHNLPPWPDIELKRKLASALKYGSGPIRAPVKQANELKLTSAKDLLAEPPEEFNWLWQGRLTAIGTSIFVSKPKVGKTTMARGLAVAIAAGNSFLGMATKKSPVAYIAAEENREQFKKSLAHLNPDEIKDLVIHTGHTPPNLIECLEQYAVNSKPGLIILDTMIRAINVTDTNNYAEMTKALEPFQNFATRHQCHVMFIHHAGKMEREHGDGVLGSTAIFGSVDTLMMLERRKDQTFLKTIQRYGESLEPHIVHYDKDARELSLIGSSVEVSKLSHEDRVLEFLKECSRPTTEEDLQKNVEGHKGAIGSALRRLYAKNLIRRIGEGKRNSPFLYSLPF